MTRNVPTAIRVSGHVPSLIDGLLQPRSVRGVDLPIVDPSSGASVSQLREADRREVATAVAAARRAFDHWPWPRMGAGGRKRIMYASRDLLLAHAGERSELEGLHSEPPISGVRSHVHRAAKNFEMLADVDSQ